MSERMVPFYCPYCGEEDLEPLERDGAWFCRGCVRSFSLTFLGVGSPRTTAARESKESLR
ncbi:hypothetical protein Acsp03_21200 [Actinomadura sp. NBRC 104412]|uniref:Insertion element protein n=1 Tax=Actinomadura sp. NBRC 104412 TaxID=3032203 RepID=UPI0024A0A3B2|nr:Insertion element protein [Actinomadura sp. NBRC 104412]GLZ04654.1 hypothetical protein Acsp03_21200 [Actinomadura sp. NBRC 104412]